MKNLTITTALCLAVFAALLLSACGNDEKTEIPANDGQDSVAAPAPVVATLPPWEDPKYKDWDSAKFENVKIYFPPTHLHAAQMSTAASDYKKAVQKISGMMGLPEPTDTLLLYYFTGPGQGQTMTGHFYPYGDSLAVYYWPNYSRGVSLMQRLLHSFYGKRSSQQILYHGLIALFDFSGENHHETTLGYLRDTFFIPLSRLATDTLMNSSAERYQSAEAASLVGFLMNTRGAVVVESFYMSDIPFDSTVTQVLGITIDSLQKEWIGFIEQNIGPIDTTSGKSGK